MKRPIVLAAIFWCLGILLWYKAYGFIILLTIIFYKVYKTEFKEYNWRYGLLFFLFIVLGFIRVTIVNETYESEKATINKYTKIVGIGVVISKEYEENTVWYTVENWEIEKNSSNRNTIKVISNNKKDKIELGDEIRFSGKPLSDEIRNEGETDFTNYNKAHNILSVIFGEVEKTSTSKSTKLLVKDYLYNVRKSHASRVDYLLNKEESEIIKTLLLGINIIDKEQIQQFRSTGLIHLLAISGLHISIIGMILFTILKRLIGYRVGAVLTFIVISVYCLYTGLHVSTLRATIMLGIYLGGYIFIRRYDGSSALSLAIILFLLYNPFYLQDIGFLLSFTAIAGIFYIEPRLKESILFGDNIVISSIRIMLSVQLALIPILLYYFYKLPTYGLIANLAVLPIMPLIVILAILMIITSYIYLPIALFFAGGVHYLLVYWLKVMELLNKLPFNELLVGRPYILVIMIYMLTVLLWIFKMKKRWIFTTLSSMLIILLVINISDWKNLTLHFMDVGQGDSMIMDYHGKYIMIDGGGKIGRENELNVGSRILMPFFESQGIKSIHTVFITHTDYDHIYGIIELVKFMTIKEIVLPITYKDENNKWLDIIREIANENSIKIYYMAEGDVWRLGDVQITCLGPDEADVIVENNNNSLLLYIQYEEFDGIFLGDTTKKKERAIIPYIQNIETQIEVVKIAHHGSATSSSKEFLEVAKPTISIISVGIDNQYGHPNKEVVERLNMYSKYIYMTSNQGEIIIRTDGKTTKIESVLGR